VLTSTLSLDELVKRLLATALRGTATGTVYTEAADESISLPPAESLGQAAADADDEPDDDALDPV
jgi:hypothetical protein